MQAPGKKGDFGSGWGGERCTFGFGKLPVPFSRGQADKKTGT